MAMWGKSGKMDGAADDKPGMSVEIDVGAATEDSASADMMEAIKKGDRKAFTAGLKAFAEACGWAPQDEADKGGDYKSE